MDARIGPLYFKKLTTSHNYTDPDVDVRTEAQTVEHQTINDDTVVQHFGKKPDNITIKGVMPESKALTQLDYLVGKGKVTLRTERWQGQVVVTNTKTNNRRARGPDGNWLVDFSIDCTEVSENYYSATPVGDEQAGRLSGEGAIEQYKNYIYEEGAGETTEEELDQWKEIQRRQEALEAIGR